MSCNLEHFLFHPADSSIQRPGKHHRHTAPSRACAGQPMICAIICNVHITWIYTKLLSHHLRGYGFGTIPQKRREQRYGNATRRSYSNTCTLRRRRQTRSRGWIMKPELGRAISATLLSSNDTDTNVAPLLATPLLFPSPVVKVSML